MKLAEERHQIELMEQKALNEKIVKKHLDKVKSDVDAP